MASPTRITELAALIQTNTAILNTYLTQNNLPTPSFSPSYGTTTLNLPPDITAARNAALAATDELQYLLLDPTTTLVAKMIEAASLPIPLAIITKHHLATKFPADSTATAATIASGTGLAESDVLRILRKAVTMHIFDEPVKGTFAHTSLSRAIAEVPHLRAGTHAFCEGMWTCAPHMVGALERFPGSGDPTETAWNLATGRKGAFWEEYANMPAEMGRFAEAMVLIGASERLDMRFLVEGYGEGWKGVGMVVDMGGSRGELAGRLVEGIEGVRVVVEDREVVQGVGVEGRRDGRVEFRVHDFFEEQPVKGADVYVLRQILHDWSDEYAARILRALIPALKKGARVVINDSVLPEHGEVDLVQERVGREYDLVMWRLFNAKERDIDDWRSLVAMADERFKITKILRPEGSQLSIIEVTWEG
ncbi:O-methyltransferase-domain-containing protein [Podospora aff. communis PSN243]|uniref:O-methyltransferase-domain-containing protein n=1 Tax=Podospora aff. communis PSN243 TaxID=3040156 RepID=A0AAV9G3Z5_9PEZI|nr:O-methyltransferase-domain-containing protein [Podospora aff. communis PSN243]